MSAYTQSYKSYFTALIVLVGVAAIDVTLLAVFLRTQSYPIDGLTSALIILPAIVIINLLLAVISYFLKLKRSSYLLLANCLLAPIIFIQLCKEHYHYYKKKHYTTYYFTYNKRKFEIELTKGDNFYSFSDVTNQANRSTTAFTGDYKLKNDSIILLDSSRRLVIIKHKLVGYPTAKNIIQLNDR